MVREVLDGVFLMICRVIRFQRHAVVAHPIHSVLAEARIALPGDLSGVFSPIKVDRILFRELPRSLRSIRPSCTCRSCKGLRFRCISLGFVRHKDKIAMARTNVRRCMELNQDAHLSPSLFRV